MAAISSNGTGGGNWSATATWVGSVVPIEGDTVTIVTGDTVTIDQSITVGADTTTAAIQVNGKLQLLYTAAADYILTLKGDMKVAGTLELGTIANPIPSTRKFTIRLNYSAALADGKYGLLIQVGGTCTIQGVAVTDRCKLNTNEDTGQTVLGVDTNTNWVLNQEIGIASTTQTRTECEKRTVSSSDATTVTITAGLTYAHSGTSPTQAEVIMLTRNIVITAYDTTAVGYVSIATTAIVDIDWCEFSYLGEDATGKRGIDITTTTGSCNIQNSSVHDGEDYGVFISGASANNITFSNNVLYNFATVILQIDNATSGTSITISNNIFMLTVGSYSHGLYLYDVGITLTYNSCIGCADGIRLQEFTKIGTFSNNVSHSNSNYGIKCNEGVYDSTLSNLTIWRNNSGGINFNVYSPHVNVVFDTVTLFGNTSSNIYIGGIPRINYSLLFRNVVSNGDTSFPTTTGLYIESGGGGIVGGILENCSFGVVSGIKTAHTNDIYIAPNSVCELVLESTILASTTEVANQANLPPTGFIKSQKHDQTAGNHKSWFKYGTIITDTIYYKIASPSQRLTPNNASYKLESGKKKAALASGQTATFSVWVRKSSVAAGGADYNGTQPRLILRKNVAAGVTADTVLATMTAGLDTWEQLSGVTTPAVTDDAVLEVVVDCDGTAGFINCDDWSAGGDGAQIDHGGLGGLADDDHTQYELDANKDASAGYVGKTLEKLNIYNAARTFLNQIAAAATTAIRTWTFPDKDITVAGTVDISDHADLTDVHGLPLFSTQNVVTTSRALNTIYQNTTGKPMLVVVQITADSSDDAFEVFSNSSTPPTQSICWWYSAASYLSIPMTFLVVPNNYYKVTQTVGSGGSMDIWIEYY